MFPFLSLIRGEYRRNRTLVRLVTGIALPSVLLLLAWLIDLREESVSRGADPEYLSRQWAVNTAFAEGAIFFFLAPFLGVVAATSIQRREEDLLRILAPRAAFFYLSRWFFVLGVLLFLLGIFSLPYLFLSTLGLSLKGVAASRLTLLGVAGGLSALGFGVGILLRDRGLSLAVSYPLVFLLAGQILLAGPFLDPLSDPGRLIEGLMVTNGFIGIASSFDLDLMRRGWLYEISPVGMYRFDYPAWYAVSIFHGVLAVFFLGLGFQGRARRLR
ncbi:MAG: hypothetical protein HY770_08355 [Chitinivibrionia bacterium]|nr:hypothetical protein [Chitinivibrionia bacterium]